MNRHHLLARACARPAAGAIALAAIVACGARSSLEDSGLTDFDPNATDAGKDHATACVQPVPSQEPAPAYIEIVLDGSGSMLDDGKWEAATLALNGLFDEYLAHPDPTVSIGLLVFASNKDPTGADGPYPSSADIPPAFVDAAQYGKLRGRFSGAFPVGPTPTYIALTGAYSVLHSYTPGPNLRAPGRRVVVLVSDGAPTAASAAGEVDVEKDKTINLVASQLAGAPSISTFAIGIGPFPPPSWTDYDPAFMSNLALAGGTPASPSCKPSTNLIEELCHIQITPSKDSTPEGLAADMLKALHSVRSRTTNLCQFDISGDLAAFDPNATSVEVTAGGATKTVPADATNGWTYDDPNAPHTVVLKGSACEEILNDAAAKVNVHLGCRG